MTGGETGLMQDKMTSDCPELMTTDDKAGSAQGEMIPDHSELVTMNNKADPAQDETELQAVEVYGNDLLQSVVHGERVHETDLLQAEMLQEHPL